jgi:hypothetical protein
LSQLSFDEAPAGEIWKPIPDYEGLYEAGSLGHVRSIPRIDNLGRELAGRILKTPVGKAHGYPTVNLCRDGKPKLYLVHRLVAAAFLGPCPDGEEVRHKDGVRTNPAAANLEYGPHGDNERDKIRHGTHHYANRDTCSKGHLLEGGNVSYATRPDGSFKQRVCLQCKRDQRAAALATKPDCTRPDCTRPQEAKGLCGRHYAQEWRASKKVS